MSQDDRDYESCDFNCIRRQWRQRVESYVNLARKWFNERLIEQHHIEAVIGSFRKMERTWNATEYIDDDEDDDAPIEAVVFGDFRNFPSIEDLLSLVHAGAGANADDISPSPAPIDLSTRSRESSKTTSPLLSSSPISAMGEKVKDVANVEEISPIPAPIDLSTRNGKSTKTTPLLDIAAAHEQLMVEKQKAEELESVRKENEALRLRLQEVEAAVDARIKEVERKKEEEFSKRVDVYVTEIKKERKKCESLRLEVASLKEELAAAKAESEQKRLPRQQAAKKLDKNEKATTHGATASKKKGKKQCGDDSFCAVKADKGFRHATRQLFQSRLVQVSECFFRKNDASSDGRVFDFDDFLNEIQGWLSILRAKNVNDEDDAKTQLHFPASSRETTSLQEEISHVLTPATTPTNYSSESFVLPLAADGLEPST